MRKNSLAVALFASLLLNVFFALRPKPEPAPKPRSLPTPPAAAEPSPVLPEPVVVEESPPVLTAVAPRVSLLARPTYVEPGMEMTVTCTVHSGRGSSGDWIGLFPIGAGLRGYKAFRMGAADSYAFTAPAVPGAYEFRYVLDDDQTSVAVSGIVTVIGTPPIPPLVSLQSLTTTVRRGEEIPARVAIHSGQGTDKDWIGLYAPDAKNEQYLTWVYVAPSAGGLATLKAPDQPGVYEIRYLLDNGYESVATSTRILVTE
ncbi:MAG TPA: hypothetical protein VF950_19775 [Planctomycetota bacterium]